MADVCPRCGAGGDPRHSIPEVRINFWCGSFIINGFIGVGDKCKLNQIEALCRNWLSTGVIVKRALAGEVLKIIEGGEDAEA